MSETTVDLNTRELVVVKRLGETQPCTWFRFQAKNAFAGPLDVCIMLRWDSVYYVYNVGRETFSVIDSPTWDALIAPINNVKITLY